MRYELLNRMRRYACIAMIVIASVPYSTDVAAQGRSIDPIAGSFPHASLEWGGTSGEAEFHFSGDSAVLTFRAKGGEVGVVRPVSDVKDALSILADKRLQFAWPALLAWAGSDLVILRDRSLQRARVAFEAGLLGTMPKGQTEQWGGDAQLVAKLQYARSLSQSGRVPDAVSLLWGSIAKLPSTAEAAYERQFLTIRLASILFENGESSTAIELIEQLMRDRNVSPDLMSNLEVNLAQYLVRSGDYRRGLSLINDVWEKYSERPVEDDSDNIKIPDSELQFAWIKACALRGLGQIGESRQMISLIRNNNSNATAISIADQSRLKAYVCMNDPAGLAVELSSQMRYAPPASDIFIELQADSQGYPLDREVMKRALQQQSLKESVDGKVAFLDGALVPAVRKWR